MFVCMMYISIYTQDIFYFVRMCICTTYWSDESFIPWGGDPTWCVSRHHWPKEGSRYPEPKVFQHLRCELKSRFFCGFLFILRIPGIRFHFKLIDARTCYSLTRYYKTFLYAEACVNFTNGLQNRLSQHWHRNEKDPSLNALALLRRDSSIPPCPATWSIMTYHAYHALTAS